MDVKKTEIDSSQSYPWHDKKQWAPEIEIQKIPPKYK